MGSSESDLDSDQYLGFPYVLAVGVKNQDVALAGSEDILSTWAAGDGAVLADDPSLQAVAVALDAHGGVRRRRPAAPPFFPAGPQ